MTFSSFCWITALCDLQDIQANRKFEKLLFPLYCGNAKPEEEHILTNLHAIEGKLLFHKICPSARQTARYWFLAGQWYRRLQRLPAAFDAFEMCSRSSAMTCHDAQALLVLHSQWGQVADEMGSHAQAHHSYEMVIRLTRRLDRKPDSLVQATEDNPSYLKALIFRLHHLAD